MFGELRAEGRALLVATHDVAQARALARACCASTARQVAFGAPARRADAPTCCSATYGDELVVLDGGRARRDRRRHHHALMLDWLLDPFADGIMQRALARGARPRRSRAGRSACGSCCYRQRLRGRVALPRDAARARDRRARRARRCCSAPPAACSWPRRRSRSRRATSGSAATSAWRSCVSALFGLGALLALSPETPPRLGELLFGDLLGVTGADLVAAARARARRRCSRSRVGPPPAGARPPSTAPPRARSARRPPRWERRCSRCSASRPSPPCQGLGNLLLVALILAPAAAALQTRAAAAGRARARGGARGGRRDRRAGALLRRSRSRPARASPCAPSRCRSFVRCLKLRV